MKDRYKRNVRQKVKNVVLLYNFMSSAEYLLLSYLLSNFCSQQNVVQEGECESFASTNFDHCDDPNWLTI